jgi:hypothetical protein
MKKWLLINFNVINFNLITFTFNCPVSFRHACRSAGVFFLFFPLFFGPEAERRGQS